MDRLWLLHRFWQRRPPLDALVAGFVGYKPPKEVEANAFPAQNAKPASIAEIKMRFPDGMMRG